MASPHPFRTIKEGILNKRPANISDKNYAVLCEAVKDLDEDSYHVDLDEDMQGIAGDDEPRPLTENPREMVAQALLKSGKPRNMSEETYKSLKQAVMALPTSISEYESSEMRKARLCGATAGHAAGGTIGSVYGFFGYNSYEIGAGVGEVVGVSAATADAQKNADLIKAMVALKSAQNPLEAMVMGPVFNGINRLSYGWKAGGAGGGAIGATNGSGTIGTNVAYVAGGVIGTASVAVGGVKSFFGF